MSRRGEQRPPSSRQLRVGEAIRHALAAALERGEVRDPGLHGNPVTVTEVRVSPDLGHATAFVVPFGLQPGSGEIAEIVAALNRAAPFLRHRVAETVRTRYAPEIVFRRHHLRRGAPDSFAADRRKSPATWPPRRPSRKKTTSHESGLPSWGVGARADHRLAVDRQVAA